MKYAVIDRSAIDQARLMSFLESSAVPEHSMNFYQLDGYLRAITSAPHALLLNDWLPLVFNDLLPVYQSPSEKEEIQVQILKLYELHQFEVANDLCNLPCEAVYASLREERTNLEQWARGYLQGYIVSESAWNESLARLTSSQTDHKLDGKPFFDELDAILYIVSTVADAKYALEQGTSAEDLEEVFERLPKSMILCGHIGRMLYEHDLALGMASPGQPMATTFTPEFVSKNGVESDSDLCPCGSGKAYKACCLH
jgi:uncharacterized protein